MGSLILTTPNLTQWSRFFIFLLLAKEFMTYISYENKKCIYAQLKQYAIQVTLFFDRLLCTFGGLTRIFFISCVALHETKMHEAFEQFTKY